MFVAFLCRSILQSRKLEHCYVIWDRFVKIDILETGGIGWRELEGLKAGFSSLLLRLCSHGDQTDDGGNSLR